MKTPQAAAAPQSSADYRVENHGTIFLFVPMNHDAKRYLEAHTDGIWFGDALVVEHRFAQDLAAGLQADGFTLE